MALQLLPMPALVVGSTIHSTFSLNNVADTGLLEALGGAGKRINSVGRTGNAVMVLLTTVHAEFLERRRRGHRHGALRLVLLSLCVICNGCLVASSQRYAPGRQAREPVAPSSPPTSGGLHSEDSVAFAAGRPGANQGMESGGGGSVPYAFPGASLVLPEWLLGTKDLTIEKDNRGREYAVYLLKAGEALYSSVVVRFCGVVDADEVNALAEKLMAYNGIRDPSRIPAGARIKIPLEYLDPELLRGEAPEGSSTRLPAARRRSRFGPHGLHVILDAGHGGNDPGTTVRGWTEDEIAYDIMVRLKRILERGGIQLHTLVADGDTGDEPQSGKVMRANRNEYVNVSPPYKMQDSRVALNMRIYLVDDLYRRLRRQGVRDENIILISIHLDHLHPAVNGVMIYYPDAAERPGSYSATGQIYASHDESRVTSISFDRLENQQVQEHSREFANELIAACRELRVPVHDYQPIRRFVHRRGGKWTPGIIHYSRVRTSVLIEAANLANRADFNRIRSASFRQRVAEAIARAIR